MRILFECFTCDPSQGSEYYNGWNWPAAVAKLGHEVHVLTTPGGAENRDKYKAAGNLSNLTVHSFPGKYARLRFYPRGYYVHYLTWLREALSVARTLGQFDVSQHATWCQLLTGTHLWKLNAPAVLGPCGGGQTMPNSLMPYLETERPFERFRTTAVSAARNKLLPGTRSMSKCHVIVTNSDTLDLAEAYKPRSLSMLLDTAIEESRLVGHDATTDGDRTHVQLLWVGRCLPRKGTELAIRAFAQTKSNCRLIFVGDGPTKAATMRLADELGCGDRVTFLGRIEHSAVFDLMRSSDGLLFTSLRESTGVQWLEAMASGLPVISLDLHGAHDWLPVPGCIKVPIHPADKIVENFAQAIDRFAEDAQGRKEMRMHVFEEAKKHTWPARALWVEEMFKKIV